MPAPLPSPAAPPPGSASYPGTTAPKGSADPLSTRNCSAVRMISNEFCSACSLSVAPGGDAMPTQDATDGLRVRRLDRGNVQAELEAGAPPRHPHHPIPERLTGQFFPVDRGRQRDPRIRVQMIHMRRVHQTMHRRVNRRGGAALAVQAVIERRDHLILPVHAGIHVNQGPQPVQPQDSEVLLRQGAKVTTGPLHPQQFHRFPGDRVGLGALGGGVPTGVVGVPRIGTEPIRTADQILRGGRWLTHEMSPGSKMASGSAVMGSRRNCYAGWCVLV